MSVLRGPGRGRAFVRFAIAVAWWAAAYLLAERAAHGFVHGAIYPLLRNAFQIFLLIVGFSYMEMAWDGSRHPVRDMGLPSRPGAGREFALGAALGWGMVTVVLICEALGGMLYIRLWGSARAWESLILQICILATASLAAEIAFRGYPFQKLIQTAGPAAATILAAIFFGLIRLEIPGTTPAAVWVGGVAAVLLSVAYLRSGALWLCWGLHFSWIASIAILFGQPLAGNRHASSVIRTYIDGPTWLTGSEYGPEGSIVALIVLWIGLYLLVRITRDLPGRYVRPQPQPPVVPFQPARPFPAAPPIITPPPAPDSRIPGIEGSANYERQMPVVAESAAAPATPEPSASLSPAESAAAEPERG